MILDKIYVSKTEPVAANVLWAKPLEGGAFSLYAFLSGKWGLLKLMNDNGTPYPDDDTPGGSADDCYTKEEIDNKLADILGLDAEGIAELKALIEDDDALTGLLGELKDAVKSVEVFHYLQGSNKPLPVGKYNYTISGLINVPKCVYNEGNYIIFRYPEDITTNSFHYLVFEEKTVGKVTGYFCVNSYSPSSEPPAWVEDAFGYTRSEADDLLNNKVDKEQGKGLSANDYTTAEKNKLSDLPTATELTQELGGKADSADLAEVATSGSYNDLSDKPDLSGFITNSVDDLMNYYLKSETYTKTEVQQLIGAIQQFHYEVYPTLPQTGASNVLYLIGPTGTGTDKYEEYVYANNDWTKIGDTSIDLSGYVTTQALTTALADYVTSSALSTALAGKENAMPITTATGTTLIAVVGNYYRLDNVGTLAITLPTITGATKLQAITFLLACGSSALVTFAPQGTETILYQEDFALEADTTYEVTALWNGSEWTLSRVIYE